MESNVCNHFGSAPYFMLYDMESDQWKIMENSQQHQGHGACNPLQYLNGESIDAMLVGGIGRRAIDKLNRMGITIYRAIGGTVTENIEGLKNKELSELSPDESCAGHHGGCH
jgi:predicted Fe-Mo cluster-binding NifX family protein